ncbi:DUF4185 domain-containing protein [Jongsikchunia kroppenstedtii]|uniref:DUF4185 domain-containing protein n=1 Tax=Jongsikchunia kroppenstedtii TaxID=1121721 RepID=UPI0003640053|nr:DUF4185 domain-containing protein [Jongsikchunia kroppenstedtii]
MKMRRGRHVMTGVGATALLAATLLTVTIAPAGAAPAPHRPTLPPGTKMPSSGCINDVPSKPQPAPGGLPIPQFPKTIGIAVPYVKLAPVPEPGPPDVNKRIPSQQPPKNICVDPCPDITDPPPPPPASGSLGITLPKLELQPTPFLTIPIPYPSQFHPQNQPVPPVMHPGTAPAPVSRAPRVPVVSGLTDIGTVTGRGSTSRTDKRWQINGTDLGITWETKPGQVAIAFGDSIGRGFTPPGPTGGDWRSNAIGFSSQRDLSKGLKIDTMVQDSRCHAAQVISSRKVDNYEITTIPTSGFALGKRQYMSYMSIRTWGPIPGIWLTNYGGMAYSDDGGSTWTKDQYARWDNIFGLSNFQVSSMVPQGDYVYMFGTPNGRLGSTALARVPKSQVLNKTAYQYWVDGTWRPVADSSATPIFGGPTGELSVRYNEQAKKWQASYLDIGRGAIVLRESATPQGLWSQPANLVSGSQYPQVYGGFIHPWSTGDDLYFTASQWTTYNIELMRVRVR